MSTAPDHQGELFKHSTETQVQHVNLRPEIELSWQRSQMSGLNPGVPNLRFESDAVDSRSRLIVAAAPVLERLGQQLGDAPYLLILADRDSRIVKIPTGPRTLHRRVDESGGVAGAVFLEETTGTNSIATVHELGQGVAVHGAEHYLESFKSFSCYGHPIRHPITQRLSGILDITCLSKADSPLLGPLIARAARDVEEQLLGLTRRAEQRMLVAFQAATRGRSRPVLVLGTGVVLANQAATSLLDPVDYILLRGFADELSWPPNVGKPRTFESVYLASGRLVTVQAQIIEPGSDGVLFEFTPTGPRLSVDVPSGHSPAELTPGSAVYIGGGPGTGRTTVARTLAGSRTVIELDGASLAAAGEPVWLRKLEQAVVSKPPMLLIEHIELLPPLAAVRVNALLRQQASALLLTGPTASELADRVAPLAAGCATHIELDDLAARANELPSLVRAMLDELGVGDRLRFATAALAALAACPWPGNLWELRALVHSVAQRCPAGDVTVSDLPDRYRRSPRWRGMTPLERAEHDAIAAALRQWDGNKTRVAQQLGISRTTLYSRMRSLHIPS